MHVSLDILAQKRHPKQRHYRTEAERKAAEVERRKDEVRRVASFLAQLLMPLVPLFSLPALTEHWYVRKDASGLIVTSKPDPPLIIAAGSIGLALGVLANLSILFRLIDTHSRLFTVSTICILTVHIIVNCVATSIFGVRATSVVDGYVLSTAFWLTVVSSAVALAVVIFLLIDGRITHFYTKGGTGLTGKQRSLIISFDIFILLLLIGTVAYRFLLVEANYLDSLYFCIQSVITTGFGDITPDTTGARIFSLPYNTLGIIAFAIVVAFTRATALEAVQEEYKTQERILLKHIRKNEPTQWSRVLPILTCGLLHSRRQQEEEQDEEDEEGESEAGSGRSGAASEESGDAKENKWEAAVEELKRERDQEFRSEAVVSLTLFLVFWIVGASVFSRLEGWTWWIAFYWSFTAFSSIGYGDYSPATQGGRAFFCVWALAGAGILTVLFSVIADAYSQRFKETFQHSFFHRFILKLRPDHKAHQELQEAEEEALPDAPSSSSSALRAHPDESHTPKEGDIGLELISLLEDTKKHLDHLIVSDESAKSHHMNSVVRRVMEKEGFSTRNREEVENDSSFKEFLYLRSLQAKLARLERLAQQAVGKNADQHDGRPSGSLDEQQEKGKEASISVRDGDGESRDEHSKAQAKERGKEGEAGEHDGLRRD